MYAIRSYYATRFANPLLGYALVEAVIGLLALGFHELFVGSTDWAYGTLLPALRITSYNVCYTKLLRSAQDRASLAASASDSLPSAGSSVT